LEQDFARDLADCTEFDQSENEKRIPVRFRDSMARLVSPLLRRRLSGRIRFAVIIHTKSPGRRVARGKAVSKRHVNFGFAHFARLQRAGFSIFVGHEGIFGNMVSEGSETAIAVM
jgi:hypothetical protein